MITKYTTLILYHIVNILTSPLQLLPDVDVNSDTYSSINTAGSYLSPINQIAPITTILAIFGLFLVIEFSYFTYKTIMWVIKRLPTQS